MTVLRNLVVNRDKQLEKAHFTTTEQNQISAKNAADNNRELLQSH